MSPANNAPADIPGLTDFVLIGRGGFSRVYRAHQARMNRDVAVKVLDLRPDMDTSKVFEKECRAAGGLGSHPNIVTIFDSGIDAEGTPWIMMPFYPAGSLDSLVKSGGPLPWRIALEHCRKIGSALAEAHRQGVMHRDIKPENVLLTEFGEPVLADFGIAQVTGATATSSGLSLTLLHAAPEVLEDRSPGPKSDVYSLGSTLYATLAGQPPFFREGESSLGALLLRVLQEPVPDLRPRGLPQNVCAFIETVMSKNPDERPTATQFAALAQELLTGPADPGRTANRRPSCCRDPRLATTRSPRYPRPSPAPGNRPPRAARPRSRAGPHPRRVSHRQTFRPRTFRFRTSRLQTSRRYHRRPADHLAHS